MRLLPFDLKTIEDSNRMIFEVGTILKFYDANNIKEMLHQYNLAEAATVVFDAMAMENLPYEGGREKFWDSVTFKIQFLRLLEPLIRFLNEEEAKVKTEKAIH